MHDLHWRDVNFAKSHRFVRFQEVQGHSRKAGMIPVRNEDIIEDFPQPRRGCGIGVSRNIALPVAERPYVVQADNMIVVQMGP